MSLSEQLDGFSVRPTRRLRKRFLDAEEKEAHQIPPCVRVGFFFLSVAHRNLRRRLEVETAASLSRSGGLGTIPLTVIGFPACTVSLILSARHTLTILLFKYPGGSAVGA